MKYINSFSSKKLFLGSLLLSSVVITGTLSSCSKDKDTTTTTEITTDDAADAVSYSTGTQTSGLASVAVEASTLAAQQNIYSPSPALNCGQVYTGNTTASYSGTQYAYDYTVNRTYGITCDFNNVHQSFNYTVARSGNYNAPHMSATSSGNGTLVITDLSTSIANATFNGTYTATTTHQSKVGYKRSFTSTIIYTITNLTMSKTTNKIVSGVASVNFSGISSIGKTYTYTGTVTFNADGTGLLVINGSTYSITIQTN